MRPSRAPAHAPGAYYYVAASEPSKSNVWLLYLEGGQWCGPGKSTGRSSARLTATRRAGRRCWDQTSCLERQANEPFLTSSKKCGARSLRWGCG